MENTFVINSVSILYQSKIQSERPDSPVPSCVSLKSDQSKREPIEFRQGPFTPKNGLNRCRYYAFDRERSNSPVPSCVSMKSNQSKREPIEFREGPFQSDQR
ncbi:unnamed protein product [Coregonus sp. 'balchen']|nr:unnamed protein product [Coregonus sp. 'balchen']